MLVLSLGTKCWYHEKDGTKYSKKKKSFFDAFPNIKTKTKLFWWMKYPGPLKNISTLPTIYNITYMKKKH